MADMTTTTLRFDLKEYYIANDPINLTYETSPAWAMLAKETLAGGYQMPVPQIYANSLGGGSSFSAALANQTSAAGVQFLVNTYCTYYDIGTIQENVIAASREDKFAWIKAITLQMDSAFRSHGQFMSIYLYGDGTGVLAQVASVSSNTVTLKDVTQVNRFPVGLTVVSASSTLASSAPTNTAIVTAVSAANGTVTFGTLPTGTVADWYLFRNGDYTTSSIGNLMIGFKGWVPNQSLSSVNLATSFLGVTRSIDSAKLAGINVNGAGQSVVASMIQLAQSIFTNGGRPNKCFMHPTLYAQMLQDLQNKSIYPHTGGEERMEGVSTSFAKVSLNTGWGVVDIYPDIWCDSTLVYMFDWDKWFFANTKIAAVYGSDGIDILRVYNDDAVQFRIRTYGQVACRALAFQGVAYNVGGTST